MKYREIARRLAGIVGVTISPETLEGFSSPVASCDNPLEIASNGGIVLTGWSEEGELFSRETGLKGPGFFATFTLKGIVDRELEAQRGFLTEEYNSRETVRRALEGVVRFGEGNYEFGSAGNKYHMLDYNIV